MRFAALFLLVASLAAADEAAFKLRQEFNQVAASIDTLVRLHGGDKLEELAKRQEPSLLPEGMDLVLVFWADDEAEIFLNGYRVGQTRLTPTRVDIPSLYVRERNELRAHCWDTDRVESGFMAGLYLRDRGGGMRPVRLSREGEWWVAGEPAEERFYTHTQPDIPGAHVIWGKKLFGELWLDTRFEAADLSRAARRKGDISLPQTRQEPMAAHQVISRLARLQERRRSLEEALVGSHRDSVAMRYQGYIRSPLAFTLGRAGPLSEERSTQVSERLHRWARELPQAQQKLIFREGRALKGVGEATPERAFEGGGGGELDRRADYVPPPERSAVSEEGGRGSSTTEAQVRYTRVEKGAAWLLVALVVCLALYTGGVSIQWWKLFRGEVWKV